MSVTIVLSCQYLTIMLNQLEKSWNRYFNSQRLRSFEGCSSPVRGPYFSPAESDEIIINIVRAFHSVEISILELVIIDRVRDCRDFTFSEKSSKI